MYGLSYDNSGFDSGLVNWYNRMIDKTLDELNVEDVSKMVRQDVLKEVALEKAIELFIEDPYDGEFTDGDLLALLISQNYKTNSTGKIEQLKELILELEVKYTDFDWCTEDAKISYLQDIKKMQELYS